MAAASWKDVVECELTVEAAAAIMCCDAETAARRMKTTRRRLRENRYKGGRDIVAKATDFEARKVSVGHSASARLDRYYARRDSFWRQRDPDLRDLDGSLV